MFIQLNLSAIVVAGAAVWKRAKPAIIRDKERATHPSAQQ
jgi:hypothetical protein